MIRQQLIGVPGFILTTRLSVQTNAINPCSAGRHPTGHAGWAGVATRVATAFRPGNLADTSAAPECLGDSTWDRSCFKRGQETPMRFFAQQRGGTRTRCSSRERWFAARVQGARRVCATALRMTCLPWSGSIYSGRRKEHAMMRVRRRAALAAVAFGCLVGVVACGGESPAEAPAPAPEAGTVAAPVTAEAEAPGQPETSEPAPVPPAEASAATQPLGQSLVAEHEVADVDVTLGRSAVRAMKR